MTKMTFDEIRKMGWVDRPCGFCGAGANQPCKRSGGKRYYLYVHEDRKTDGPA